MLPHHPGQDAATDSFGGYCYLYHAAAIAQTLSLTIVTKVVILGVDYHRGNEGATR
jgi:acetoin utilization deacetylase AcuC-like enzyme